MRRGEAATHTQEKRKKIFDYNNDFMTWQPLVVSRWSTYEYDVTFSLSSFLGLLWLEVVVPVKSMCQIGLFQIICIR